MTIYKSMKNKLNVLNVYKTYFPDPPGGLQEAIRQICFSTSLESIENTIFTLSPQPKPNYIKMSEGNVFREKSWLAPASCDLGGISAFSNFSKLAKQADVLHYFFPWPFADVLHNVLKPEKPAMLTYISDVVRQRFLGTAYIPLMWSMLRQMKIIVANCPAYAETSPILSNPLIRDKVRIIPLGINEDFYPKEGDQHIFNRIGISTSEPYFLFLGVLRYYKGIHTLISAAKLVNLRIVIAGSGPEEEKLKKQVEDLGAKNIIFAGQVSDKEKVSLIQKCKALILPSHLRSEAYGMVLVEASMMGKPMISCEIGTGTSFVNLHEETGLVVKPENVDEMADAMRIFYNDNILTQKLGHNARSRYENMFSGKALGKAYSAVYQELL
ncbi:glycosyltransferase [Methylophilaceae bacterium]|nr:glycosyltransferase [Methylophilaceae bacterium]